MGSAYALIEYGQSMSGLSFFVRLTQGSAFRNLPVSRDLNIDGVEPSCFTKVCNKFGRESRKYTLYLYLELRYRRNLF